MLKASGSIDQASIKEYPTSQPNSRRPIGKSHRDGTTTEGQLIYPRQRRAALPELFLDDPSPGLVYQGITTSSEVGQQGGITAARTP
jgi:hypothetical protein